MRLDDGAKIYNFARIEKNEEIEEESAREEEAIQNDPIPMLDDEAETVDTSDVQTDGAVAEAQEDASAQTEE